MTHKFDFLVIGSGIAGLNFALQAAEYGKVGIVTKKELMESNSNYAQGGIAAVLDKNDNFEKHIKDTMKAGCYLNDKKAVETMVKQAPKEIKRLLDIGVGFAREQNQLSLTQEGGHSKKRIAHAKDATGKEIERALIYQVRHHKNITIFESHFAADLIIQNNQCLGAMVFNDKNEMKTFLSKATILATGGAGQVYKRNSNPKIATGDGIAMAYRAGAEIRDMEFIQFHPTALAKQGKPAFLLSETLRGEGGILKNKFGRAFMIQYHPKKELAPRDIVARAIFSELKKGRTGTERLVPSEVEGSRSVYLDIRHRGVEFIKHRFPYIYNELWWYGIKMEKDLIPVAPAAHFVCGGVHTNLNGETNIPGLFAFGEVAHTGVHGANRLASNSLLECMVFSSRTVKTALSYIHRLQDTSYKLQKFPKIKTDTQTLRLKQQIQNLMWNNVGIVRHTQNMKKTLIILNKYHAEINKILTKSINKDIMELKNLCQIAMLITEAALNRRKSIGAHYII